MWCDQCENFSHSENGTEDSQRKGSQEFYPSSGVESNAEFTEPLEVSPLKEDLCDDRGVEKKHEEEEKWVWTQSNVPCLAKCTNLIIKYYERL